VTTSHLPKVRSRVRRGGSGTDLRDQLVQIGDPGHIDAEFTGGARFTTELPIGSRFAPARLDDTVKVPVGGEFDRYLRACGWTRPDRTSTR
jgi:hypothetical protein